MTLCQIAIITLGPLALYGSLDYAQGLGRRLAASGLVKPKNAALLGRTLARSVVAFGLFSIVGMHGLALVVIFGAVAFLVALHLSHAARRSFAWGAHVAARLGATVSRSRRAVAALVASRSGGKALVLPKHTLEAGVATSP